MKEEFELRERFDVPAAALYRGWLDGEEHGAMTGAAAAVDARVGGVFSAWDEYITGKTLELKEDRHIVQSWRTTEFADTDEDSRLEILLERDDDGTVLVLRHTEIPQGQGESYRQGWVDHYFRPMHDYFGG